MWWDEYAGVARGLAEVRAREAERRARVAERIARGRIAVEQLGQRLTAQRDYLVGLAVRLREPGPSLAGVTRAGASDVDGAVHQAWQAIEQADVAARLAEERANLPALLPGMSTTGRNALVYAGSTLAAWLASCSLFVFSSDAGSGSVGLLASSLCGLPAMALLAGYITIALFGQPRIRTAGTASHSIRLGALICFAGLWLGWLLLLAGASLL